MYRYIRFSFLVLPWLVYALFFISCQALVNLNKDKVIEEVIKVDPNDFRGDLDYGIIKLDPKKTYKLTGPVIVKNRAKLVIPAGTKIVSSAGKRGYILIEQDSKIEVNGEPFNPVVMTSSKETPAHGDWAGLMIFGKSPTNKKDDENQTTRDPVTNSVYGGTVPEDISGSISYLRIEYAGINIDDKIPSSALGLYGVGSKTQIKYVQLHQSASDGIKIYGGSVSLNNIISTSCQDNGLNISYGWNGSIKNVYIVDPGKVAIKGSNNVTDIAKLPETTAKIANVSLVNEKSNAEAGVELKHGGGYWMVNNICVKNFKIGIRIPEPSIDPSVEERINNGGITFNPIYFESDVIVKHNYIGNSLNFIIERKNSGASSYSVVPGWAVGWGNEEIASKIPID